MPPKLRPKILCVDDEPRVLEGLALNLGREYEVHRANSGAEALESLGKVGDLAVVLSDMRMPGMDGAALLGECRRRAPDTVRMLLTGQSDLAMAAAAVNEGQIFRFLFKPCPTEQLLRAVQAACEQHRLITAERVLVEQTLRGAIRTLTEVLAVANPAAFGRAGRIQRYAKAVADRIEVADKWAIEVAAMLSQIGWVTVPAELAQRYDGGQPLTPAEQEIVEGLPATAHKLLGHIPRLEPVLEILAGCSRSSSPSARPAVGVQILQMANDFDALDTQGLTPAQALDTMRGRSSAYDPTLLGAFAEACGNLRPEFEVRELPIAALRVGMVLTREVKLRTGMLLVARGHEVTQSLLARLRNFPVGSVQEPVRVSVRRFGDPA
jgi:CheY-like chemotaxis protein